MTRYYDAWRMTSNGTQWLFTRCGECGAVVAEVDQETHTEWHDSAARKVEQLRQMYAYAADHLPPATQDLRLAESLMSKQMYVPEPEEHTYRRSTAKAWYQDDSDTFILTQVPMPDPDDAMVIRKTEGKGETYHATWTSYPKPVCGLNYGMDTPVYPEAKLTCHYCKRILGRVEH